MMTPFLLHPGDPFGSGSGRLGGDICAIRKRTLWREYSPFDHTGAVNGPTQKKIALLSQAEK